jgi:hypothetical protein
MILGDTSQIVLPRTEAREMANISSAARLKAAKRQCESSAKKPSPIPSRRASTDGSGLRESAFAHVFRVGRLFHLHHTAFRSEATFMSSGDAMIRQKTSE